MGDNFDVVSSDCNELMSMKLSRIMESEINYSKKKFPAPDTRWFKNDEKGKNIAPGPRTKGILGNLKDRRNRPLELFTTSLQKYGGVVRFRMGPMTVHLVSEPEGVKRVLQENYKNYIKGFGYDKLAPVLGNGLLLSEGEFWRRQRKLSQPAFHRQRLMRFGEMMVQTTEEAIDSWVKNGDQGPIDISHEMMKITLKVVGETLLSEKVGNTADRVSEALDILLPQANKRILALIHLFEGVPTPWNKKFRNAIKTLNEIIHGIIEERRKTGEDKGDLLSMLMQAQDEDTGEQMSNQQLRDEVMTIFLAGHETTATTLSWTLYLLSKHPDVRKKCEEEVKRTLNGRKANFEDTHRLPYLTQVIQESMRLYPPAWIFSRQTLEADEICGYHIPKGSIVLVSPYAIHHWDRFWENPEGFDPERFTEEKNEKREKYSYIPFSAGPRQCIGNNFAMMEAQLILATILSKVECNLVPGYKIEPEPLITLRPKNGIMMRIIEKIESNR